MRNLLRHYRQNGKIEAKPGGGYQQPIIQNEQLRIIQSLLKEKNDLLLKELCDRYEQKTGIRVSIPTMHRAIEKLGLRCKKSLYPSEKDLLTGEMLVDRAKVDRLG